MKSEVVEKLKTEPESTDLTAELTPEGRLKELVLARMKSRKITLREIAKQLTPPVSHGTLSTFLQSEASFSINRFQQFCKILEIDPIEAMMDAMGDRPQHAYLLTDAQEKVLCESTLHYKIAYTIYLSFRSISRQELSEKFPDHTTALNKVVVDLLKCEAIRALSDGSLESPFLQIPKMHFSPEYDRLLGQLAQDFHRSSATIQKNHEHLSKYVLTKFHPAYLTPEQMIHIRAELLRLQQMVWSFQQQNMSIPELRQLSSKNFMALLTFFAPMNAAGFIRDRI